MRSAAMFIALMATGVLIVLIYIWSGESIAVLIMTILTLFAGLAILEWRPWDPEVSSDLFTSMGRRRARGAAPDDRSERVTLLDRARSRRGNPGRDAADDRPDRGQSSPAWRNRFDITWDTRGVSGVALGQRAPQLWSWSQIDDITYDWCQADPAEGDDDEQRLALRLDFPNVRNPEEPENAFAMFGPEQHPVTVAQAAREAWRQSKVTKSRLYDLTPEERTWRLADHFGHQEIDLREPVRSPELLYQEIRRALLSNGDLCRLAVDAGSEEILDAFDRLLSSNGAELLTEDEAQELQDLAGEDRVSAMYWTLDWAAEQRGFRLAFLDQGGQDYLIGLVSADSADDWDGQTVGSGSARVLLDLPRSG